MKKLFTLALVLMGLTTVANAATVDDIAVCKHSYCVSMWEVTNGGTAKPGKGQLFGDGHFLDVTGGSVAQKGKGAIDLSTVEEPGVAATFGADYPGSVNCTFRLKNAQDVIATKVTAGSTIYVYQQSHGSRSAKFAKDAKLENVLKVGEFSSTCVSYTATDDELVYIGSEGGDLYIAYVVVMANEAEGTPVVKVGAQTYDNGLWFIDVTATPVVSEMFGETGLTYTIDGSDPLTSDTKKIYDGNAIRCYQNTTVKFQAWMKGMEGMADCEMPGADNEGYATFKFNAPTVTVDGANVTIATEYAAQGGTNKYSFNETEGTGDNVTLSQSATFTAWTEIANGSYGTFSSPVKILDVYVLNPISEAKTIKVNGGTVVVDDEATANATDGQTVYTVENGSISVDPMDFFVKDLTFKVVNDREKDKDAKYQVPAGQEIYIQMSNTNISFMVQKPVHVKVTTTLNSCKTLNPTDDENVTTDRKNYVNVSGTTYGNDDVTAENGNIIEFDLPAKVQDTQDVFDADGNKTGTENVGDPYFPDLGEGKVYTFQKYSGTGNILISSIEFTMVDDEAGISNVQLNTVKSNTLYNLAGQKVSANYKGIVIKNGQKFIVK